MKNRKQSMMFLLGHARELATDVLARPSYPADLAINRFFRARRYLGSHDRRFLSETVYDLLRNVQRYCYLLELPGPEQRKQERPAFTETEAALLLGTFLLESSRRFATDELREGLRLEPDYVQAIRQCLDEASDLLAELPEPRRTAVQFSMPEFFVEQILAEYGHEEGERLLAALNRQAPIVLRANTLRTDREALVEVLSEHEVAAEAGTLARNSVLLRRRINANALPEFREGWFELQDEGSQLLSELLDPHPNWRVFDACAGAGGKALHLAAIMRGRGEVIAHDVNERRLRQIKPRLKRSGAQNVRVMDHAGFSRERASLQSAFDALLIDAPCSGTGVLRRNPGARLSLDREMLNRVTSLQQSILEEYHPLVKPGGLMLYATCSLLCRENEEQVLEFLAAHSGWEIEAPPFPDDMRTPEGFFRVLPHRHDTDGFFGALLRRTGTGGPEH